MTVQAGSTDRHETVRLLSYNVHGLRDDRAALASVVRDAAPDVVVVQEAPRRLRWRSRCAQLAHSWQMLYAAGGQPSLGNVIMATHRVRVRESWCLRYPLTPGRHMRGAVFARCAIGETTFVVAGSHFATEDAERGRQASAFRDAITAVSEPVIIAADVNETAGGASWQQLLADGRRDAARQGPNPAASDWPTFPAAAPSRRIDAVFVDPRCTVEAYTVIDGPAAVAASDHLPVLVTVRVST